MLPEQTHHPVLDLIAAVVCLKRMGIALDPYHELLEA